MTTRPHRARRAPLPAVALALVAGLLLVLVTSCGGDEPAAPPGAGATTEYPTPSISPAEEVLAAVEDGALVVDVRTPEEYAEGHIAGALNIDVQEEDFEERVAELDPSRTTVVYCATGRRAEVAARAMRRDPGFDTVLNGGGFEDLAEAGLPTRD